MMRPMSKQQKRCCCFTDLKQGVIAAGIFVACTAFTQIVAECAFWWLNIWRYNLFNKISCADYASCPDSEPEVVVSAQNVPATTGDPNSEPLGEPDTKMIMFIILTVFDVLMIFISLLMICGVTGARYSRNFVLVWILCVILDIIYEAVFNILTFIHYSSLGSPLYVFATPVVMIFIYWVIKVIITLAGLYAAVCLFKYLRAMGSQPAMGNGGMGGHGDMRGMGGMGYPQKQRPQNMQSRPQVQSQNVHVFQHTPFQSNGAPINYNSSPTATAFASNPGY